MSNKLKKIDHDGQVLGKKELEALKALRIMALLGDDKAMAILPPQLKDAIQEMSNTYVTDEVIDDIVSEVQQSGNEIERYDYFGITSIIDNVEHVLLKSVIRKFPEMVADLLDQDEPPGLSDRPSDFTEYTQTKLLHVHKEDERLILSGSEYTLVRTDTLHDIFDKATDLIARAIQLLDDGEISDADDPLQDAMRLLLLPTKYTSTGRLK